VKDAFVFQFQPIDSGFSNLILHTIPHPDDKASEGTVAALERISQLLADEEMVVILKSCDGDSAYHRIHRRAPGFVAANLTEFALYAHLVSPP
jgi:hypothetical protein